MPTGNWQGSLKPSLALALKSKQKRTVIYIFRDRHFHLEILKAVFQEARVFPTKRSPTGHLSIKWDCTPCVFVERQWFTMTQSRLANE